MRALQLTALLVVCTHADDEALNGQESSWPTQRGLSPDDNTSTNSRYLEFMEGCYTKYDRTSCDKSENERITINSRQPSYMTNYTAAGYAKVPEPYAYREIREYYEAHKDQASVELWAPGNTYTNHWESPTLKLELPDALLQNLDIGVQLILERWSGIPLQMASMYGIRIYQNRSILAPHVDRYVGYYLCHLTLSVSLSSFRPF